MKIRLKALKTAWRKFNILNETRVSLKGYLAVRGISKVRRAWVKGQPLMSYERVRTT